MTTNRDILAALRSGELSVEAARSALSPADEAARGPPSVLPRVPLDPSPR